MFLFINSHPYDLNDYGQKYPIFNVILLYDRIFAKALYTSITWLLA
tara:strand:+ start:729 stop:866 length:138 start_codon:yes stop_codon:yes gene_type:complete